MTTFDPVPASPAPVPNEPEPLTRPMAYDLLRQQGGEGFMRPMLARGIGDALLPGFVLEMGEIETSRGLPTQGLSALTLAYLIAANYASPSNPVASPLLADYWNRLLYPRLRTNGGDRPNETFLVTMAWIALALYETNDLMPR